MSDFWREIAELTGELHPERIAAIAVSIERLPGHSALPLARSRFGPNTGKELYARLHHAWTAHPEISPREVAAAMRGASEATSLQTSAEILEFVWSGPSTGIVPVRKTEQVVCEIIDGAFVEVFIVSFVAYKVDRVVRSLQAALSRGIKVKILLEESLERGGSLDFDSRSLMQRELRDARFFAWKANPTNLIGGLQGKVHGKCVVADGKTAFVSSANLTAAAMEHNMEIGLLVRGGSLPRQLNEHMQALIAKEIISPV